MVSGAKRPDTQNEVLKSDSVAKRLDGNDLVTDRR